MPLVGHAFVGLATGMATQSGRRPGAQFRHGAPELWLPAAVVLAYLPDIAGHLLALAGSASARPLSHSLLFAVVTSAVLAPGLARLASIPRRRAFTIGLLSLVAHLVLDLAQSTDRVPFWPFSARRLSLELLPASPLAELALFGGAFLAYVTIRQALAGRSSPAAPSRPPAPRSTWAGRGAVALLLGAAVTTHGLRALQEQRLYDAHRRLRVKDYAATLVLAEEAERWPSTAKPGRLDYLRAEAWAGLGDPARAEAHYLRSYAADPDYFWCVADLALFYARSSRPAAERRRLAAPYLERLAKGFWEHPDLKAYLGRISEALAMGKNDGEGGKRQ